MRLGAPPEQPVEVDCATFPLDHGDATGPRIGRSEPAGGTRGASPGDRVATCRQVLVTLREQEGGEVIESTHSRKVIMSGKTRVQWLQAPGAQESAWPCGGSRGLCPLDPHKEELAAVEAAVREAAHKLAK